MAVTNVTRSFTADELEELGVPDELDDGVLVDDLHVGHTRWHEVRRCLFYYEGGVWSVNYHRPATEMQDAERFPGGQAIATLMESYDEIVTKYRPVTA